MNMGGQVVFMMEGEGFRWGGFFITCHALSFRAFFSVFVFCICHLDRNFLLISEL